MDKLTDELGLIDELGLREMERLGDREIDSETELEGL